jgi:hypothetical protein
MHIEIDLEQKRETNAVCKFTEDVVKFGALTCFAGLGSLEL